MVSVDAVQQKRDALCEKLRDLADVIEQTPVADQPSLQSVHERSLRDLIQGLILADAIGVMFYSSDPK